MPRFDVRRRLDKAKVGPINEDMDRLYTAIVAGFPRHRENGHKKIPVRENTGNLEILPKHRRQMEFCLLKL